MSSKTAQQLDINVIAQEDPLQRSWECRWPGVWYADDPQALRDHGSPSRISPQTMWSGCSSSMQSCAEHPMAGVA